MRPGSFFLFLFVLFAAVGRAQEPPEPVEPDPALERLRDVVPALENAKEQLAEAREALAGATTEQERADLEAEVDEARASVEKWRNDFLSLASGVEESRYVGQPEVSPSLQESFQDIIEPISRSVREATSGPREMDELRRKLEKARERKVLAEQAVARMERLREAVESETVLAELEDARETWRDRLDNARIQITLYEGEIADRRSDRRSTFEKVSAFFQEFWKSRGLNLIVAIVAAVLAVVLVQRGARLLARAVPQKRKGGLAGRTADLFVKIGAGLFAVLAVILVFYLRGDWLLLALVIVALLGILWASRQAIPPYMEQIRLMLNIGPVREGERVVYQDVPWRVERLAFYCTFRNPELSGGSVRLPVRDVIAMRSRAPDPKEPWFPSRENDWVILADETFGKVVEQTPEQVVVLRLGGSRKTYATADYFAQSPESLSAGFRVNVTFGIDYDHQAIATSEVPGVFLEALETRLQETFGREAVRSVKVEFAGAGASSLDYAVLADFDGSVAHRRNVIERLIQSVCVDVCNERGWVIPFTQITLHQHERADGS